MTRASYSGRRPRTNRYRVPTGRNPAGGRRVEPPGGMEREEKRRRLWRDANARRMDKYAKRFPDTSRW